MEIVHNDGSTISDKTFPASLPVSQAVPVVDMQSFYDSQCTDSQFAREFTGALKEIGFCVVVNHGVEQQAIDNAYSVARELFELPLEVIRKYHRPELAMQRGYAPFGNEHAKDSPTPDLKSFYHIGRDPDRDSPHLLSNIWPTEIRRAAPVFRKLYAQLDYCGQQLLRACAIDLGEDPQKFTQILRGGDSILRVLHYPEVGENSAPSAVRAGAHEDINLLTLLCEATEPGLEVKSKLGEWIPVVAKRGQIVVNVADMLQSMTNGVYRSTTHRVVNPPSTLNVSRFSMPFFVHPKPDVRVGPLSSCISLSDAKQSPYKDQSAGEFLNERLREIGLKQ